MGWWVFALGAGVFLLAAGLATPARVSLQVVRILLRIVLVLPPFVWAGGIITATALARHKGAIQATGAPGEWGWYRAGCPVGHDRWWATWGWAYRYRSGRFIA